MAMFARAAELGALWPQGIAGDSLRCEIDSATPQETRVNFSWPQWIMLIVLDILFRAGYSFLINFHPLMIPLDLKFSLVHLAILIPISKYLVTFNLTRTARVITTLFITNALFAIIFVANRIYLIKSGSQTVCSGIEMKCAWVNGVIMSRGVWTIALLLTMQIIINLLPIIFVTPLSSSKK